MSGQMLAGLRPETATGIVMSVTQKLAFLHDEAVRRFTSCDLSAPDFRALADPERQIALYWQVHEEDVDLLKPLSSLFFTLLLHQLCQGEGELPAPVALLLDEFAQVGRIPKFPNTIAVARGRGVSLMLGIQSLAQLDALYGKAGAEVIRTNCCTKVVMPGLDYDTAEHISKALGETTVRQEYQSRRPEGWLVTSYSYGEHHTQRRLMTADEVRRIGDDEALLIIANTSPSGHAGSFGIRTRIRSKSGPLAKRNPWWYASRSRLHRQPTSRRCGEGCSRFRRSNRETSTAYDQVLRGLGSLSRHVDGVRLHARRGLAALRCRQSARPGNLPWCGPPQSERFDPSTSTWTSMATIGDFGAIGQNPIWTGRELVVWGGQDGARYDPATDHWSSMSLVGSPPNGKAVWTDQGLIVLGLKPTGNGFEQQPIGARYVPPSTSSPTAALPPSVPRDNQFFAETCYRVDDAVWNYFTSRGGVPVFGYPTSRLFTFQGRPTQFFQTRIIQLDAGGQPGLPNMLDPAFFPLTDMGITTGIMHLPDVDSTLLALEPDPSDLGALWSSSDAWSRMTSRVSRLAS